MVKFPFIIGIIVIAVLIKNYNKKDDDDDPLMKTRYHF